MNGRPARDLVGAAAVVLVLGSGSTSPVLPAAAEPARAPARTAPASVAVDHDALCRKADRREGFCPIDDEGRRLWEAVAVAFEHRVTPTRLAGSEDGDGTRHYGFQADIGPPVSLTLYPGRPEPARPPELWVLVYVPPVPVATTPSAETNPDVPKDARWGEGYLTLTRSDGTLVTVRMWGAKPVSAELEDGELDVVRLYRRAVAALSDE